MGWPVQPLLFFLARCTRNQLIRQIEFLKAENQLLRKRVPIKHIHLKADERDRLFKLALAIGPEVKHLVSIVTYDTIRRWRRKACGFIARGFSSAGCDGVSECGHAKGLDFAVHSTSDRSVVEEQAKAFIDYVNVNELKVDLVTRDNDQIYKKGFDRAMNGAGIRPKRLTLCAPNLNVYVERFIQTIQAECMDHFLIFGEKHFDYLVKEYVEHYHEERPHQGLGNLVPTGEPPPADGDIHCRTRLGGLLKHYYRVAA